MSRLDPIIFLDGRMTKASHDLFDTLSPGLVTGRGIFETMRAYDGRVFALKEHLMRATCGLKLQNLKWPCPKKKIGQYIHEILQKNNLKDARLRLMVWQDQRNLRVSIMAKSYYPPSEERYHQGFKAISFKTNAHKTRLSHVKSLNYSALREAYGQAQLQGAQEAIILSPQGYLIEGSRTNTFFVQKGTLYTPAIHCGALNGITRQMVIRCARQLKIPFQVGQFKIHQLRGAQEAFLTNSLLEIMPLTSVDGRPIHLKTAGPITLGLLARYRDSVLSVCRFARPWV